MGWRECLDCLMQPVVRVPDILFSFPPMMVVRAVPHAGLRRPHRVARGERVGGRHVVQRNVTRTAANYWCRAPW